MAVMVTIVTSDPETVQGMPGSMVTIATSDPTGSRLGGYAESQQLRRHYHDFISNIATISYIQNK